MTPSVPLVSPYGQIVRLNFPLENVECWNFTGGELFTVPAGLLVRADNCYDATRTTVCVVDAAGEAPGLELVRKDGSTQTGYRFIVGNVSLAAATGLPMPPKTIDIVGDLIAYETGHADGRQTRRLFRNLRKTGIGYRLQGHYSSRMGPRSAARRRSA